MDMTDYGITILPDEDAVYLDIDNEGVYLSSSMLEIYIEELVKAKVEIDHIILESSNE